MRRVLTCLGDNDSLANLHLCAESCWNQFDDLPESEMESCAFIVIDFFKGR